ncbi:MAG: preprotein translocase subunit SecA [Candidatus Melainabacteria bacterium GWF2_37_15]|nr:MAG: preprotein translocase subunit SecA [Candidatus Melainabacteria bacterium GWF2_37_15]
MIELLLKVFGDPNERKLKQIQPTVEYINTLEPEISSLSDEQLRAKTDEFKSRYQKGETLDSLLPEAFAVVREAGKRVLNMRHFDMQLVGGMTLHQGKISEMRTGEGKTLVATLPAYLNALTGKGVHIVTVNDYLAKRDSEWMGRIYKFLGFSVGLVLSSGWSSESFEQKKNAYAADITYGTNNEFGFDYLRDNMAGSIEQCVQRPYNFAIVDEVDSILIDEARTPLIISGKLGKSAETYKTMARIAPLLEKDIDYELEEKHKNIILNEDGIDKAQELLNVKDLFDPSEMLAHYLLQALKAKELYNRDTDYVIKDGQVVIVDEFTGRLMDGRRWSDGLHQAVEAKEGVKIQDESQTLASITFQNLFRLYPKLAGMTGTALTEEAEFGKIYNLEVTSIPTNRKDVRKDHPDVIYKTELQKYKSVVEEIETEHEKGRPILVGTISIDKSEVLSKMLTKKGLKHNVLNAKHHEKEAAIIAQAGRYEAITIATNMAGRGTDIILGGNPEFLAKEMIEKGMDKEEALEEAYQITEEEHKQVVEAGGLYVIGTERHESRRIDNQLRGRAARQGDPGSTRFFLSLEDSLMRIFGGERISGLMEMLKVEEDMAIESSIVSAQIASAQKKVETYHFDTRKQVLQYDDVINQQRELFYKQRRKVLEGENVYEDIIYMVEKEIERIISSYINPEMKPAEYVDEDLHSLVKAVHSVVPQLSDRVSVEDIRNLKYEDAHNMLKTLAVDAYKEQEKQVIDFYNTVLKEHSSVADPQAIGSEDNMMRTLERDTLLRIIDSKWIDHLHNIDMLRDGIGLRAYGQKDPLIEYKREAFGMFNNMMHEIQRETVAHLYRTKFQVQIVHQQDEDHKPIDTDLMKAAEKFVPPSEDDNSPVRKGDKVGRNEACPCGSGQKYKKCCGAERAKSGRV